MVNLRPYQKEAIERIATTFSKQSRQYVEMPTGAGKTVTFLSYATRHKRILIIVPSKQLLRQVYETALLFFDRSEISRKGDHYFEDPLRVHICIVNSIRGEYLELLAAWAYNFDLVIIDEAHHSQANSYQRFISYLDKKTKILGVTATPDRADGRMLDEILYTKSYSISTFDLIDKGYLCDIEGYCVKTKIDISDVSHHNGDYSLRELYKRLCVVSRNEMIINLCKDEFKDRKTLLFCINIQHSKELTYFLKDAGISAAHIDGTMSEVERSAILSSFRRGEISVLCNCQLLTEGFDEPSIDGLILARPTKSRALYHQMIGRGLRTSPGKTNCKIVDIVDNHKIRAGFANLCSDLDDFEISSFKSVKEIRDKTRNEEIRIEEYKLERAALLGNNDLDNMLPTASMYKYLDNHEIKYHYPTFDEASFLIWKNELWRQFYGKN